MRAKSKLLGTSTTHTDTISLSAGYWSSDPAENPLMHNWNMVELAYCDGGSFSGTRGKSPSQSFLDQSSAGMLSWIYFDKLRRDYVAATPLVTPSGALVHFRGAAIVEAVQDTLLTDAYGLASATDVVVSGCSAGGLATFMQCDRWADRLTSASASADGLKVRCLPDSGMFLDVQDDLAASDAAAWENPVRSQAIRPRSDRLVM